MRILIKVIAALVSVSVRSLHADEVSAVPPLATTAIDRRIIVDPNLQKMVDSMTTGAVSNGMACGVDFSRTMGPGLGLHVYVINTTTNYVRGFIRMPFEGFARVELFDPQGKPVRKTKAGEKVGWTESEIANYCIGLKQKRDEHLAKHGTVSGSIAMALMPQWPLQVSRRVDVSELFCLKQAGEYTLRLQMRVAQNQPDKEGKPQLHIFPLPEVTAKINILSEDVMVEAAPQSGQTNAPIEP